MNGSCCTLLQWCRLGRCVSRGTLGGAPLAGLEGGAVDGGWSDWSAFSDCASGCLSEDSASGVSAHGEPDELRGSTGIMVSTRRCNNPRPENGGKPCQGSDRRYRACTAMQVGGWGRHGVRCLFVFIMCRPVVAVRERGADHHTGLRGPDVRARS